LVITLRDKNETVQGVAAAALGQIGDKRALKGLRAVVARTSNSFVKSQAQKAIKRLSGGAGGGAGPSPNTRFFVTVGKMSNKSRAGGARLSQVFSAALKRQFGKVRGVATTWTGGKRPSAAALRKRRVKGFVLDGAITRMSQKNAGSSIEISCSIRVSLATYPGNSMKAFYTGGASISVPARGFSSSSAFGIYKDLVEGAATGAREHIVQSYLSHQ
ncbi:MAG: HEAT repeat domain-containing protein, partial [Deltaproteobacteria bacterium]|nr:HEAT repeat domain-containing protein [Deltaproteobacteria bacterium]